MADALHGIKIVARRTGLSAHVIRIWEKRYGAVEPDRTDTNRRLYSEEQIERLKLFPYTVDAIRLLNRAGFKVVLIRVAPIGRP